MKSFALSTLLIGGASAHLNGLCSCTDSAAPGQVDFIFPTYHATPPAGGSVPGKAHITNPMGVSQEFTFSTFKAGESSNSGQGVTKRIELLKSSGIVTQTSTCSCYGAKPAGSELTPAMGTSATTNTCSRGGQAWKTLYKATVTGAASGNYYIWTTGTGMDLDPDPGMCSFTSNAKLAIGLSVADGKAACSTAAPTVADASNGAGCEAGSISGSQCAQTCTSGLFASGETSCYDGAWTSTFACSGAKACSASAAGATFNGAVGVIGSNCGFDTADGADCYLGCAEGSGHTGQKVECNDGTWTVTDEAVVLPTCVVGVPQATNDGPGNPPTTTTTTAIPRSPDDPDIVRINDDGTAVNAPRCHIDANGHTVVAYNPANHDSFKCTVDTGGTTCTCTNGHPDNNMFSSSCKQLFHKGGNWADTGFGNCAPVNHKWEQSTCTSTCGGGQYTHACVEGSDAGPNGPYPVATTCAGKTAPPNAGSCNTHRCCDCRDCNGNPNNGHHQCTTAYPGCDGLGNGPWLNGCYSTANQGCDCSTGNLL